MRKTAGVLLLVLGGLLLAAAAFFLFRNRQEDVNAGAAAESVLLQLTSQLGENAELRPAPERPGGEAESLYAAELPAVEVDGYEYVGYVELPVLSLRLPVMADWDYERLKIAPCRQFGSSRTDDLVIAAHNYRAHFGRLREMQIGDLVTFTDMDGLVNTYAVRLKKEIAPTDVASVEDSGYDLVLYTCNYDSSVRVALFCSRTTPADEASASSDLT